MRPADDADVAHYEAPSKRKRQGEMGVTKVLAFAAPLLCVASAHAAPPLKILVDSSTAMPMALIAESKVVGGIHRDVGLAIARELNAQPVFIVMPRKRIPVALQQGKGHIACHFLPEWMPGEFDWSEPFMPNALVLLSNSRVPRPTNLAALRGIPIGTVLGFQYPDVSQVLGSEFVREDAVDATRNLMKFDAGRSNYALTGEVFLRYQQGRHKLAVSVQNPLVVKRYLASCAVSRATPYPLAQINRAIHSVREHKELEAIYDKYR
jgi:polar amino acid transport system substrate-binding protein